MKKPMLVLMVFLNTVYSRRLQGSPTPFPTFFPTAKPTPFPTTNTPTSSPSTNPTSTPSVNPTVSPTIQPSRAPTLNPIEVPTIQPSSTPTISPTTNPSIVPTTLNPTNHPTSSPSKTPTISPSFNPTNHPINSPTKRPTIAPSLNPTKGPSTKPSSNPTRKPTSRPSINPTRSPSIAPSLTPTAIQTTSPSLNPTTIPSTNPSTDITSIGATNPPSINTTPAPSINPTASITQNLPTTQPSVATTSPTQDIFLSDQKNLLDDKIVLLLSASVICSLLICFFGGLYCVLRKRRSSLRQRHAKGNKETDKASPKSSIKFIHKDNALNIADKPEAPLVEYALQEVQPLQTSSTSQPAINNQNESFNKQLSGPFAYENLAPAIARFNSKGSTDNRDGGFTFSDQQQEVMFGYLVPPIRHFNSFGDQSLEDKAAPEF